MYTCYIYDLHILCVSYTSILYVHYMYIFHIGNIIRISFVCVCVYVCVYTYIYVHILNYIIYMYKLHIHICTYIELYCIHV